jgi:hypothetical protein
MAIETIDLNAHYAELEAYFIAQRRFGVHVVLQFLRDQSQNITFYRYKEYVEDRAQLRLRVYYDTARLLPNGSTDRDYRFQILPLVRGLPGPELVRFETDYRFPTHAHFAPGFTTELGDHYTVDRWPAAMKNLTLAKVFSLRDRIALTGTLPRPIPFGIA